MGSNLLVKWGHSFISLPCIDVDFGNLLVCDDDSENAKFKGIEDSEMTSPSA